MTAVEPLERDYTLSRKAGWFARAEAPARARPELLDRARLENLTKAERLAYDDQRSVWHANLGPIITPQMQAAFDDLDDIVEANRQDGDKVRSAAVISAPPGLGKTTVAVSFGVQYHRHQIEIYGPSTAQGHDRIPVVYVGLTSNTTMRSLNSALCRFYGHPGADKGNATQLANRATDCVLSCGTRLVIVDDVHFLDMNRRDCREVANHFKWLANQFPVTFLFVGVGLRERGLLSEGLDQASVAFSQTARRWTTLSLNPFEVDTDPGRRTWRRLLLAIEHDLVLADMQPGMLNEDLAAYLFVRSGGHFASLMTLIARGCRRAIKSGAEQLTADLLDTIRNDEAAEQARAQIEAGFTHGLRTTKVTGSRTRRSGAA
jgi:hypothetical protein